MLTLTVWKMPMLNNLYLCTCIIMLQYNPFVPKFNLVQHFILSSSKYSAGLWLISSFQTILRPLLFPGSSDKPQATAFVFHYLLHSKSLWKIIVTSWKAGKTTDKLSNDFSLFWSSWHSDWAPLLILFSQGSLIKENHIAISTAKGRLVKENHITTSTARAVL